MSLRWYAFLCGFGSDVLFYNRSLKKHIILLSKCTSRLANKRIHIKLVSSASWPSQIKDLKWYLGDCLTTHLSGRQVTPYQSTIMTKCNKKIHNSLSIQRHLMLGFNTFTTDTKTDTETDTLTYTPTHTHTPIYYKINPYVLSYWRHKNRSALTLFRYSLKYFYRTMIK